MPSELSPDAWARIRYDYEHTERPIPDICAEHGISSGTLRDRMRRWGWARRRPPIPAEGPPPATPAVSLMAPDGPSRRPERSEDPALCRSDACLAPTSAAFSSDPSAESNPAEIVPRLQGAVARVLPAIEAIVARLGTEAMPTREIERAGRALSSLTRTLRELNALLRQQTAAADPYDDDMPEDIDAFRFELARRINAFVASEAAEADDQPTVAGEPATTDLSIAGEGADQEM